MGHGIDVCMGDPRLASSLEECLESEFVGCLVRQAGLVIVGEKPAAVFGFKPRVWRSAAGTKRGRTLTDQLLSIYAKKCARYGLRLVWLARHGSDLMLLAWKPSLVEGLLADAQARDFMAQVGLCVRDAEGLVCSLVSRLRAYYAGRAAFPHEVGVVLGYPFEDVRGFMRDGGRHAKACGRWKVYGDPERAQARFEELGRAERRCKRLYSQGVPMRELLAMGAV